MQSWWREDRNLFSLNEILSYINEARKKRTAMFKCLALFNALSLCSHTFSGGTQNTGEGSYSAGLLEQQCWHSDDELMQLFLGGIGKDERDSFCMSKELADLAMHHPQVMNHETLNACRYDPNSLRDEIVAKARAEHQALFNAHRKGDATNETVLVEDLVRLLLVIRSNICAGERTERGPDLQKVARDRQACDLAIPLIELFFEILFQYPETRLAMYGTLRRGESNHFMVEDLPGEWIDGGVNGKVTQYKGYPMLIVAANSDHKMDPAANNRAKVEVLQSAALDQRYERLDVFEGEDYERIWVPVHTTSRTLICNVYAAPTINRSALQLALDT
jgi:gamma-glutamylcyclotransferase (GGCT)/AIG2-like uncharacterized protein YtfP